MYKVRNGLYKGWIGWKTAPKSYIRSGGWRGRKGWFWTGDRKTGIGGWFTPNRKTR